MSLPRAKAFSGHLLRLPSLGRWYSCSLVVCERRVSALRGASCDLTTTTSSTARFGVLRLATIRAGPVRRIHSSRAGMADLKDSSPRDPISTHQDGHFEHLLENAVRNLQNDFTSGARQMADASLSHLSSLINAASHTAKSREELWQHIVTVAKALSGARPSMDAAITSCLLRALEGVREVWNDEGDEENTVKEFAGVAERLIEGALKRRKDAANRLAGEFVRYVGERCEKLHRKDHITIATLSNSSTIRSAILATLTSLPNLHITLHILESRPRCEGADMASQILSSVPQASQSRLHITIFPDSASAPAVRTAHLVLLGADRISTAGDVSNKIGSVALAAMTRCLDVVEAAEVVVVSDVDKIVADGIGGEEAEVHPASELTGAWAEGTSEALGAKLGEGTGGGSVTVFGEWFEWVPAAYVDAYITEEGRLDRADVKAFGRKIGELRERIFGFE
ncbi:nagb/rpia/CoA transferase-like protein [Lentithecium fluviatile CBS 122367]|uniref:Nagb/rpia/CoA transferase-like protein n=1 Tax=Lentithecium fluviatile CBS 122367 TaxID=1168545 RepID=A0A6G1JH34_9PLEO|nr:nagb/rpia/CoA transferase-like protein [Lentithecium fluviatile CBS 122367]